MKERRKLNQAGFSLVEIMIMAGILTTSALVTATLFTQQYNANAFLSDQVAKVEIMRNINAIINLAPACSRSLAGVSVGAVGGGLVPVTAIRDSAGNILYQSNTIVNNLQIGQITVSNQSAAAGSTGFVTLEVPVTRTRALGGPQQLQPIQVRVIVSTDIVNAINSCGSDAPGVTRYSLSRCSGSRSASMTIPGSWDLCTFSGFRTTADDSNIYDGCSVIKAAAPGSWRMTLNKHSSDCLYCYANCMNL